MRRYVRVIAVAALLLGFLATGLAQQVITTTTTTLITLPGTSYTTTIELPGGNETITIQFPEYVYMRVEKHPDRVCTIVISPKKVLTATTVSWPDTTITIPGTTVLASLELTEPTYTRATTYEVGGETMSYTSVEFYDYVSSTEIPGITTIIITLPIPVEAEIQRYCDVIEVVVEETLILESVPATVMIGGEFGGLTYTLTGYTATITYPIPPELTETSLNPTTKTVTEPGTTMKYTTTVEGSTYTTTIFMNATTITTVVTEPGSVITSTITYTTTVEETSKPTETTPTKTTTKPPPPPPPPKPPKTTTTQTEIKPPFPLGLTIIAASAVLILAGAIILFIKRS